MSISNYTVRITNDDGKITAWIDKNNNLCIEQPNHPDKLYTGENWSTEQEAQEWANAEAAKLSQMEIDAELAIQAAAEKEAQEAAARQALIDSATRLDEIHAMLTQLTNNN